MATCQNRDVEDLIDGGSATRHGVAYTVPHPVPHPVSYNCFGFPIAVHMFFKPAIISSGVLFLMGTTSAHTIGKNVEPLQRVTTPPSSGAWPHAAKHAPSTKNTNKAQSNQ